MLYEEHDQPVLAFCPPCAVLVSLPSGSRFVAILYSTEG